MNQERLEKIKSMETDVRHSRIISELTTEIERLQAEVAAYQDYISGKITLGQLEAALDGVEVKR